MGNPVIQGLMRSAAIWHSPCYGVLVVKRRIEWLKKNLNEEDSPLSIFHLNIFLTILFSF